jgi:hypothetical protein
MPFVVREVAYTLAIVLVLAQMAVAQTIDFSALRGRWVLESVDGKPVGREGGEIYFQVTEQAVTGYDGCNRFGISVANPGAAIGGQRGCPPESKKLPIDPSDLVTQLGRATVSGNTLSLPLPGGKGEARFRRSG